MNARFVPLVNDLVFEAPYSNVTIAALDVKDQAVMRVRQLQALLLTMQGEDGPDSLLWLAQQISDELAVCVGRMGGAA